MRAWVQDVLVRDWWVVLAVFVFVRRRHVAGLGNRDRRELVLPRDRDPALQALSVCSVARS